MEHKLAFALTISVLLLISVSITVLSVAQTSTPIYQKLLLSNGSYTFDSTPYLNILNESSPYYGKYPLPPIHRRTILSFGENATPSLGIGYGAWVKDEYTDRTSGVSARQEVHPALSLPEPSTGDVILYAPTLMGGADDPLESVTIYWRNEGSGSTGREWGVWNHSKPEGEYPWEVTKPIDSTFLDNYVHDYPEGKFYRTKIEKVGQEWKVSLYNFNTGDWEVQFSSTSSRPPHESYDIWENYNLKKVSCPDLPRIESLDFKAKIDGDWKLVTPTYGLKSDSMYCDYGRGFVDEYHHWFVTGIASLGDAVDNTDLLWSTGGHANWFGQANTSYYDGDAAQSGDISDGECTWLKTTVSGSGAISFWWKVDSQSGRDYLRFYIDGEEKDRISGSTSWAQKTYSISSGSHTLTWKYTKDGSGSSPSDCGWVDMVTESCSAKFAVYQAGVSEPEEVLNPLRELRDDYLKDDYVACYYNYSPDLVEIMAKDPALVYETAALLVNHSPMVEQYAKTKGISEDKPIIITRRDVAEVVSFAERLRISVLENREQIGAERSQKIVKFLEEFEEQVEASEGKTFSEALQGSIYYERESTYESNESTGEYGSKGVTELNVTPAVVVQGETISISGKASPDEGVWLKSSFAISLPVSDGNYSRNFTGILFPAGDKTFSLTAENVKNIRFFLETEGGSIEYHFNATNGSVTVSVFFPITIPGKCNITVSGDATDNANYVNLMANASIKVTADSNGDFSLNVSTEGVPIGEYPITAGGIEKTVIVGAHLSEALDNTELNWTTGGDTKWFGQTETYIYDNDSAQSAPINDLQSTYIQTEVTGPGNLTFYWKVSSEADYDFLRFFIDDIEQASISGEVDWHQMSFDIGPGSHNLKWSYTKDEYVKAGSDCGWVDKVVHVSSSNYWNYDGFPLNTSSKGTVCGDVYISAGDHAGLDYGPYFSNFSLPKGIAKWARLYVGVQSEYRTWLDTIFNGEYLGDVILDKNGCLVPDDTNVYGSGNGVWMVSYNCTHNVNMDTQNTALAITDGGVYSIVLVVVYENASLPKVQYWINEGNVNLNYQTPLNNTVTRFNGTAYNSTEANLTVLYYTGTAGEPDYLYLNSPYAYDSPYNFSNISWDILKYRGYQLDSNDVANGFSGLIFTSAFDLDSFTSANDSTPLKDIINTTAPDSNYVIFWR